MARNRTAARLRSPVRLGDRVSFEVMPPQVPSGYRPMYPVVSGIVHTVPGPNSSTNYYEVAIDADSVPEDWPYLLEPIIYLVSTEIIGVLPHDMTRTSVEKWLEDR